MGDSKQQEQERIVDQCMYCGRPLGDARGRTEPVCYVCKQTRTNRAGKQQLADAFAKRKAEGTETEGLLAPTHLKAIVGGKADSVVITAEHAQYLTVLIQFHKRMFGYMNTPLDGKLTPAYCDELLEDLKL